MNETGPFAHDMKGQKLSFDARVDSVFQFEHLKLMHLGLRVQNKSLAAIISASSVPKATWDTAQKLTTESIIRVTGYVAPQASDNGEASDNAAHVIVYLSGLDVIAWASPDLPSSSSYRREMLSRVGLEERLSNRILDVRYAASGAIFKLHSGMCQLIVEFLFSNNFQWIHTPRIITATVPGDNEYFHLPYFGQDAWLAQSSQQHKQMALSMDMERVFEIGPVFRAEVKSSDSARHLTEVGHRSKSRPPMGAPRLQNCC
jgi:aspartyl-tRNA synthetase